jgi:hypothetical protein
MKALTICQPYSELIARGDKRVENRTWSTPYRGLLYIHAGKSKQWLSLDPTKKFDQNYNIPVAQLSFGAVIAIADLIDCVHISRIRHPEVIEKHPWLSSHEHVSGPWCFILNKVSRIGPWPWRGAQGMFDIDEEALGKVANKELGIPEP